MSEEFKESLNEFLNNKTYIVAYRSNYDSAREFNKDLILYIKQLQEENQKLKEDILFCLKSVKQEMEMSIDSRTKQEMLSCYQILNEWNDK